MAEMVLPPAPPNLTYKVEKLNPLAFPKGMDLRCELTGKPALVPQHGQSAHAPRQPRRATGHGSATGEARGRHREAAGKLSGRRGASGGPGTMLHCLPGVAHCHG